MSLPTRPWPRRAGCAVLALALGATPPLAWPQVRLPALGEAVSDDVSVGAERRLGEQVMREIRRDPDYLDDAALLAYVLQLWQPLVGAARARGDIGADLDTSFAWEAFLVRDRSVNAFALPGGYVGVHLGLIAMTSTADELASVLGHELAHVTQRHIARGSAAASRQGAVALAAMILGMLAASRSSNPDVAQAAVMGSQAAALQGQLNYSRDMEREADRMGLALLQEAGFAPAGMAAMFERLDAAQRHNDSLSYPYLRSHPLTTERIGEARVRSSSGPRGAAAAHPAPPALHGLMQARAKVLMDSSVQALRRVQSADAAAPASFATPRERMAALYGSALASSQLREPARAERALAQAQGLLALADGVAAARALALLGAQLALAQGDGARAAQRLGPHADDGTREALLLGAQVALAGGSALPASTQALQAHTALHRMDAQAWGLLAQLCERQGLRLRALRAEAEVRAALGDLPGALDRLRAGQRLARGGAGIDFVEASVIDARLRELTARQRELTAELRDRQRGGAGREPPQE